MKSTDKYKAVDLSLNLSGYRKLAMECNGADSCNPGGSYGCLSPTDKCPPGTCVGTSCRNSDSAGVNGLFEAQILVDPKELEMLQKELINVVKNIGKRK